METKKVRVRKKKLASMTFANSSQQWSQLSALLYGPPGSGKTYFAGTAVEVDEMREVLFIDNDGGTRTLMGNSRFPNIQIVRPTLFDDYGPIITWLSGSSTAATKKISEVLGDPLQYKTVVIDNLGKMHTMILDKILKDTSFNRQHPEIPAPTDYRLAIVWMRKVLDQLSKHSTNHDVNIILTAHVKGEYDDQDRLLGRVPMIPGQLATIIPGDMPLVAYLTAQGRIKPAVGGKPKKNEVVYTANFAPFDRYTLVKNQSPKNIGAMTDPSMPKLYKLINS